MKQILSLLLCYVLLSAETFAMRGWGGSTNRKLNGSFGLILTQTSPAWDIGATGFEIVAPVGSGIGLVLMNVPASGPATGNFIIFDFNTGETLLGILNGLSATDGKLTAILNGTLVSTSETTGYINGLMYANYKVSIGSTGVPEVEGVARTKTTLLYTTGLITFPEVVFNVDGVQQPPGGSGFSEVPVVTAN